MPGDAFKKVLIAAACVFMILWCLLPFTYMVLTSLAGEPDFLMGGRPVLFSLENYREVLTSRSLHFPAYLRNSLVVSAVSAVVTVLAAGAAAYALTRLPIPGKVPLLLFTLAVSMFPQISLVGYLFRLMTALNWINSLMALVLPYIAWILPLSLWILVSYFAQIPAELDKAGLIDGCSRLQVLVRVIFPVAAPGLLSTALLAFIFAFNEFMFALVLTTDRASRTIPVGIALFEGLHGQVPWGHIMAAATMTVIPVIMLTLAFQRHIIQGLTRGAVKG